MVSESSPTDVPETTVPVPTVPTTTATPTTLPSETCGGPGWRRIAFLNMTNPNQTCPQGLSPTDFSIRSCKREQSSGSGCSSTTFSVGGLQYSQVCGRATAYRWGTHRGFYSHHQFREGIDSYYVDGLSLTHGSPRTHIWTFASGVFSGTAPDSEAPIARCPCDPGNPYGSPSFVGNNYFCDSITTEDIWRNQFRLYPNNAIWDGEDVLNTCYGLNNPPWFNRTLSAPTSDDIEFRVCFEEGDHRTSIGIVLLELYVY